MSKELIPVNFVVILVGLGVVLQWSMISHRRRSQTTVANHVPGSSVYAWRSSTSRFIPIPHSILPATDVLRELETTRSQN